MVQILQRNGGHSTAPILAHTQEGNWDLEGFQVVLVVKNLPANAGDIRDTGSISGQEDPLEEGMATHSTVLAWRIPWTEEPGYSL